MSVPGYILLIKKPGDPKTYGPTENSFSVGIAPNRTQFFWTSLATSNLGGTFLIDGRKDAERSLEFWALRHPEWEFSIHDARDADSLPVVINWDVWLDAHEPSDKTFSGIKNKYEARNLRFVVKGEQHEAQPTKAPPLTGVIMTLPKD